MLRLCIDPIIYDLQTFGGVTVYTNEMINYFSKSKSVLISNPNNSFFENKFPRLKYYTKANNIECDIFHSSYYTLPRNGGKGCSVVTTVHDFTHEHFISGWKSKEFSRKKNKAIISSNSIVAISKSTADDTIRFLGKDISNKVEIVPNGISSDFFWDNDTSFEPFILFIGSRVGYKNFDFCVDLVRYKKDIKLKICGGSLTVAEFNFLESNLPGRYEFLGFVDNSELNNLYSKALCLVYPSSYEGFGIPVIEAAACGCPVIALNCSSLPEVVFDEKLLLNELNISQALDRLDLYQNGHSRKKIVADGVKFSKKFSWNNTFSKLDEIYRGLK
jgi:mannosyltransferase